MKIILSNSFNLPRFMAFSIIGLVVQVIVNVIFVAPVLWLSGRMLVGSQRAKFSDALLIVTLGAVAGAVIGIITSGIIGSLIQLVVWLYLVKKYYECSWLRALAVSIVATIISAIIITILAVLGLALFYPIIS